MQVERRHPAANTPATCIQCGADFFARSDRLKAGGGKYCSNACAGRSRITAIERPCDLAGCATSVRLTPSELKRSERHYCSPSHQVAGRIRSVVRKCGRDGCLEQRRIYPSRQRLTQHAWYHDRTCRGLASRKPAPPCLACGAELTYDRTRRRRRFCDQNCAGKARQRREVRNCDGCPETFVARPGDSKRYHSIACYWRSHAPKPMPCRRGECSKLAQPGRRYCSRDCSNRAHVRRQRPAPAEVRNSRIVELHAMGFKAPTIIAMLATQFGDWPPYQAAVAKLTPAAVRQIIARHGPTGHPTKRTRAAAISVRQTSIGRRSDSHLP